MILSLNANGYTNFPSQKKTDNQRTEKYLEECVDAGISLIDSEVNSQLRKSKKDMVTLYNLINGKIDPKDKKKIVNPLNIEGYDFPGTARTYPLIAPLMSVLAGEEKNRTHFLNVGLVNEDGISQKQDFLNSQLNQLLIQGIQSQQKSKDEIQQDLERFGKWSKFTYKDKRERMAFQVLKYLNQTLNLKFKFDRGIENLLTVGEELYIADIIAGEPVLREGNPLNFTFIGSNNTPYPEDCSIIIEDGYVNIGTILDDYYEDLTPSQIKNLEDGTATNKSLSKSLWAYHTPQQPDVDLSKILEDNSDLGSILGVNNNGVDYLSGGYNNYGQIRRTRVLWRSMRQIGILSFMDKNGKIQKMEVPETYIPNTDLGEHVKKIWISEWMEGTKLANTYYVKIQPRPVQFRSMSNLSKCSPGIVGIINNINTSKVTSFVSALRPIQYLYDEFMYRMQTAFMTSYGNIGRLDVSQVPDGWDMDKWLYYATVYKWAVQDPMKEGEEGVARGKLSGGMNQPSNSFTLDQGNMIQQNMMMLEFLERRANDIAGITPQRKGSIANRETVGGVERAVVQSAHRTEKWFSLHDFVRLRANQILLETAKVAWRDNKFKRTFVLDDMTQEVLDFDSKIFNEGEYGVIVNNSKTDTEIKNIIENKVDILLQRGVNLSTILRIKRTEDISTMIRKIEAEEDAIIQRAQQNEQAQIQQQETASKRVENLELEKIAADERNNIRNNQTKLVIASDNDKDELLTNEEIKNKQQNIKLQEDRLKLDAKKLDETIRHNNVVEKSVKSK